MKREEVPAPWALTIPAEIKKGADEKRLANDRDRGGHGKTCMCLILQGIWEAGRDDYQVQIIHFGLHMRDRVKMTPMDRLRIDVVNTFMELFELGWDGLCEKVVGSEENAQTFLEFYDATLRDGHLDASGAMSSLTLDAVFLTVFLFLEIYCNLREHQGGLKQLKELQQISTEVGVACNLHQIFSDVWLVPNQIPLQLIGKDLNLVKDAPSPDALIEATVDEALRRFKLPCARADVPPPSHNCTHLLQCLYITMCPAGESKHGKNVSPGHTDRVAFGDNRPKLDGIIC